MDLAFQSQLFKLEAVSIVQGNCYLDSALNITRKLLQTVGQQNYKEIPVSASNLPPVNDFPEEWKSSSFTIELSPMLNLNSEIHVPLSPINGPDLLAQTILSSSIPLTVIATGPLSDIAYMLKNYPGIESNIQQLIVMGGALFVPGNVEESSTDGSAEWNFYWDPEAAYDVWNSNISQIILFPLDATNQITPSTNFIRSFGSQFPSVLSILCGDLFTFSVSEEILLPAFDSILSSSLSVPSIVTEYRVVYSQIVADGSSQGQSYAPESSFNNPCLNSRCSKLRPVVSVLGINADLYFQHFSTIFAI